METLVRLREVAKVRKDKLIEGVEACTQEIQRSQGSQHARAQDGNLRVAEVGEVAEQDQESTADMERHPSPFEGPYRISVKLTRM